MSEQTLRSGVGVGGLRSPRKYTREEVAAAKRVELMEGTEKYDSLRGPLFWATGDYVPEKVRKLAADYALLLVAIEREWPQDWAAWREQEADS